MKTPTPFWPLLKSELALGRRAEPTGAILILILLLAYWGSIGLFPLVSLYGKGLGNGSLKELFVLFDSGFLEVIAFLFLCVLTFGITYTTVPAFLDHLPSEGSVAPAGFEFYFTRAIDRRILFRTRTTAMSIFLLTPFVVNMGLSAFTPEVAFGRAHGVLIYTTWLAWNGILAFLLLQMYSTSIAQHVKPNDWWTASWLGAPILLLLVLTILKARGFVEFRGNVWENNFLFFAAHPLALTIALAALVVAVQAWCERKFSKLEIF